MENGNLLLEARLWELDGRSGSWQSDAANCRINGNFVADTTILKLLLGLDSTRGAQFTASTS